MTSRSARLFLLTWLTLSLSPPSWAGASISELAFDLEMKDFHDTSVIPGPIEEGTPLKVTFKNNAILTVIPLAIEDKTVRLKTQLIRSSGNVLYSSAFMTKYNVDAELSEKTTHGDLLYRLRINPKTEAKK